MAESNQNNSGVIEEYLKRTKHCKILDKATIKEIALRIKSTEKKILDECLMYSLFRAQLVDICNQVVRNNKNAIKYSRKLTDDSELEEIRNVVSAFLLISHIMLDQNVPAHPGWKRIPHLLEKAALTSSSILQMIEPIKENYQTLKEYRQRTQNIYRFLEVKSDEEYDELARKCEDPVFRRTFARTLHTDDTTLIKKLRQQEEIMRFYCTKELGIEEQAETIKLIERVNHMQATYQEDRERLIQSNLPLVINRATKFQKSGMDLEDLIQEGNIGLIKAVDKFDPHKDVKLSTYATWWIDQAVRRGIANKNRTVRVPIHVQEGIKKLNKAYFALSQKLKREPTLVELAEKTGQPLSKLTDLQKSALHEVGIDMPMAEGVMYSEVLFDKEQETPYSLTSNNLRKAKVRAALSDLTPRSQKIIRLRFGIGVESDHTLDAIGQKFQVTKERIRQIESKALNQLRNSDKLDPKDTKND